MPQTYETPPMGGGVRGDQLPGVSRPPFSLPTLRAQLISARYGLSLNRASLTASLAFGEARHG